MTYKQKKLQEFDEKFDYIHVHWLSALHPADSQMNTMDGELSDQIKIQLKDFISHAIDEAQREAYKQGVLDEIVCVETSGEHLDLQKNLTQQSLDKGKE